MHAKYKGGPQLYTVADIIRAKLMLKAQNGSVNFTGVHTNTSVLFSVVDGYKQPSVVYNRV